ncbi:metalloregulator ArsR/SmtB family transcription factor [Cohnella sp.]|uniref:metalloregulator ArsR/SmtB family transcription factor n=1 Tax=Cohnella sp. TaxID=1883426 RepID=UPI003565121F
MNITKGRLFKDGIYKQFSRIGKSLSSEKRLELLNLLSQGPKSVEKLAQSTDMPIANVSHHLQVLSEARLVKSRKKGTFVFYEVADPSVITFLLALWEVGEQQLTDIKRLKEDFMNGTKGCHTLTLEEVMTKQNGGEIVLLDVRPTEEYNSDHIPGALSIPIDELAAHLNNLPADREIVAYCRGPYCVYAAQAVSELRNKGFSAFRIEEGVHEWKQHFGNIH